MKLIIVNSVYLVMIWCFLVVTVVIFQLVELLHHSKKILCS